MISETYKRLYEMPLTQITDQKLLKNFELFTAGLRCLK